eukprot:m.332763 g.332763  ORF g.332763 m.332763 type:complete len:308 (+) comp17003_c0_seq1:130-1053(+)
MGDTKPGYGLIIPKKDKVIPKKKAFAAAASAFGGESSSEDENEVIPTGRAGVNHAMLREAQSNKGRKRTQDQWQKAVDEDETVFQYDEVYDQISSNRMGALGGQREADKKNKPKRKAKYIYQLIENTKKKKLEDELREERQAQREREKEGAEFGDKEKFVTSAYKKRLIELKKAAEEEKRKEALEAANDVRKRGDLSDLYRNIMNNNLAETEKKDEDEPENKGDIKLTSEVRDEKKRKEEERRRRERRFRQRGTLPDKSKEEEEKKIDPAKFARKTTEDDVNDAKARYLARKAARAGQKLPTIDDDR